MARFWRSFIQAIGSTQRLSSAFHPSTNGAVERANAMVECYLRSYVSYQQTDCSYLLPFIEVAYNNAVHCSTGFTSFHIVSGQDFVAIPELEDLPDVGSEPQEWTDRIPTLWPQIRDALNKAANEYKSQADKKRA